MKAQPCRRCRAEAMVEPTALGWKVECSVKPMEHQAGPCRGRDAAVRKWNEMQKGGQDET